MSVSQVNSPGPSPLRPILRTNLPLSSKMRRSFVVASAMTIWPLGRNSVPASRPMTYSSGPSSMPMRIALVVSMCQARESANSSPGFSTMVTPSSTRMVGSPLGRGAGVLQAASTIIRKSLGTRVFRGTMAASVVSHLQGRLAGTCNWTGVMKRRILLLFVLLFAPNRIAAQQATSVFGAAGARPAALVAAVPGGGASFAIEAAGGIGGSLLGFGLVYLLGNDCDVEDLGCNLETAFGAMALGTAVSAGGAYLAGRLADTQPSGVGAVLGSVAGAAAGVGLWHLFTEELDLVNNDKAAVLSYSVAQGIVTALGSRIGRAIR